MGLKEKYIFICGNLRDREAPKPSCRGSCSDLPERFKAALAKRGLKNRFRAAATSCLDFCEYGPMVSVMPDGIWYHGVRPEDIDKIIDEHLLKGNPVARLVMQIQEPFPQDDGSS